MHSNFKILTILSILFFSLTHQFDLSKLFDIEPHVE